MAGGAVQLSAALLTVNDVCDLLRVGPTFVYRHAAELGGVKVGRHLRFQERDICAWLDGRRVEDPADSWRSALQTASAGRKSLSVPPATSSSRARRGSRAQLRSRR